MLLPGRRGPHNIYEGRPIIRHNSSAAADQLRVGVANPVRDRGRPGPRGRTFMRARELIEPRQADEALDVNVKVETAVLENLQGRELGIPSASTATTLPRAR
jgi:hypothetical protein